MKWITNKSGGGYAWFPDELTFFTAKSVDVGNSSKVYWRVRYFKRNQPGPDYMGTEQASAVAATRDLGAQACLIAAGELRQFDVVKKIMAGKLSNEEMKIPYIETIAELIKVHAPYTLDQRLMVAKQILKLIFEG